VIKRNTLEGATSVNTFDTGSHKISDRPNLQKSRGKLILQKYFNTQSVTTMVLQYRQTVKHVFNVSAILIHVTVQKAMCWTDTHYHGASLILIRA